MLLPQEGLEGLAILEVLAAEGGEDLMLVLGQKKQRQ